MVPKEKMHEKVIMIIFSAGTYPGLSGGIGNFSNMMPVLLNEGGAD